MSSYVKAKLKENAKIINEIEVLKTAQLERYPF